MEILDDENERSLVGEPLEEPTPGSEGLSPPVATELALGALADEREQLRLDPRCVR